MRCKLCGGPTKKQDTGMGIIRVWDETATMRKTKRRREAAVAQLNTLAALVESMARNYERGLQAGCDPRYMVKVSTLKKAWDLCSEGGVYRGRYNRKWVSGPPLTPRLTGCLVLAHDLDPPSEGLRKAPRP